MPIYCGGNKISEVYKDGTSIKELYNGSDLVFSSFTPQTIRFDYTGAVQTFTVPSGCNKLIVDCVGARGGQSSYVNGGRGGRVQCTMSVSTGQVLYVYVGGAGEDGGESTSKGFSGGWNGGGKGWSVNLLGFLGGYGGGGATDVRIGGTSLTDRKIVAGGGGGSCFSAPASRRIVGGFGGGLTGGSGGDVSGYYTNATGGTQSSGGNGARLDSVIGGNGSFGNGGNASSSDGGGGGGAGYYGGGGGLMASAGAGGSSYTDPDLCTNVVHTQGYSEATGNGWIIITTAK